MDRFKKIEKELNEIEELIHRDSSIEKIQNLLDDVRGEVQKLNSKWNSSNLYEQIFQKAPIGIFHYNSEGYIDVVNEKCLEILNSTREKIIGLQIADFQNESVKEALEMALKGKIGIYEGIYTSVTSGSSVPIRSEVHPELNNDGDSIGGIGMVEDISERYEANKKLRESEVQYRTIFEQNDSIMLVIDIDGGFIYDANPAALEYYGWSLEEFQKMKMTDINMQPIEKVTRSMREAQNKDRGGYHCKHRLADGTVRDVEVFSGMILLEGKHYLYSIIHDITEKEKAKKELLRFKLGIENSSEMIMMTNLHGEIEYINDAFLEKYKFNADEVIGKTPRIIKSGQYEEPFYDQYWQNLQNEKEVSGEIINKAKNGDLIHVNYSTNPIIDERGNKSGYIAIQHDITEQKEAEKKLADSLKEKEVLLGEIHHRVKNNLAIISALLELSLYQKGQSISINEFVSSSQMRIKAMAEVHEMLYENEKFSHICVKEYIERLIKKVYSTVHNIEKAISFSTNIDEVELNINQAIPVGLIIDELIMNALKHAFNENEEGAIHINLDNKGELINISVSDDGTGFAEESDPHKSNTLGMTLLNVLSQQVNGDLNFDSTDTGLTCSVEFPLSNVSGSSSSMPV